MLTTYIENYLKVNYSQVHLVCKRDENNKNKENKKKDIERIVRDWPEILSQDEKKMIVNRFQEASGNEAFEKLVCGSCSERKCLNFFKNEPVDVFDERLNVLIKSP